MVVLAGRKNPVAPRNVQRCVATAVSRCMRKKGALALLYFTLARPNGKPTNRKDPLVGTCSSSWLGVVVLVLVMGFVLTLGTMTNK